MASPALDSPSIRSVSPAPARPYHVRLALSDLFVLTKARANVAVVGTTFVGFALNADLASNSPLLLSTLGGTALVAAAAAIANQARELSFDQQMPRTRNRPIAAGRVSRESAFQLSAWIATAGCLWLGLAANTSAMLAAALALVIYVFAYTPLKRSTPACTLVGAVSGALPLLVGWSATGADAGIWLFVPFAILFLWQIPHFLAFAWWRKAEYLAAGYRVLPSADPNGRKTAAWSLCCTLAVFAVSLAPALMNHTHSWYWPSAIVAGTAFSLFVLRFSLARTEVAARALFIASLYYLPAIYTLMLLCKTT